MHLIEAIHYFHELHKVVDINNPFPAKKKKEKTELHLQDAATSKSNKANARLIPTIMSTIIDHKLHGRYTTFSVHGTKPRSVER